MKWAKKIKDQLTGLTDAIARFPLTTLFLLGAAITNAYMINAEKNESKYLLVFLLGAFLSAVAQAIYERFYSKHIFRYILMGTAVLLTAGYYLIINPVPTMSMEIQIRTAVALFALLIAFIWIPSINSRISFNKSFMIVFKSLFHSLFFSGVIFAGISVILGATNLLIMSVDYTAYPHGANIIFVLFAPMYFLSLIPVYSGLEEESQLLAFESAANCPKFLQILISYIVIPLITIFTLILVIYLVKNIGGEFWTDNLLEPMIVSYSITVILVYILASDLENKFAGYFRKIFPKILVPLVVLQIIASYLTLTDTGLTHTRYYVILYGLFAVASGIFMSFFPVQKNGVIAALLILFSVVSSIPPIDAFTISKHSQMNTLEEVLLKNGMLENDKLIPKESIPDEDKEKVSNTIQYLWMMNYTDQISYLPKDFDPYKDFRPTFGFDEYKDPDKFDHVPYTIIQVKQPVPINISGHDFFMQMDISLNNYADNSQFEFEKEGKQYILKKEVNDKNVDLILMTENKKELLVMRADEVFDKFADYKGENFIPVEDATFTDENAQAKMTLVIQNLEIQRDSNRPSTWGTAYIFIKIK